MSTRYASVRSLAGRKQARTISWVMTAAAVAFLLAVIVAHAEPCSGSTAQQVASIARMGSQPGLLAFFCTECGTADTIWSLPRMAAASRDVAERHRAECLLPDDH